MRCTVKDQEFLSLCNNQFSVDVSEVFNPYSNVSLTHVSDQ